MRQKTQPSNTKFGLPQIVFFGAFRLSMIWDLLTTFLGTLLILDGTHFVALGLSLVGTLIAWAFNFFTWPIWNIRGIKAIERHLLRFALILAIVFDFVTSFICNVSYVALGQFTFGRSVVFNEIFSRLTADQFILIFVLTVFTTISPMMLRRTRYDNPNFLV
ncbi:MAG: hypothetical protein ACFB2W_08790 [Leptolyngbyaceae cyanobacterium]